MLVFSQVIEEYFGGSFHFVPPICAENVPLKRGKLSSIPLQDSLRELHLRIGKWYGILISFLVGVGRYYGRYEKSIT